MKKTSMILANWNNVQYSGTMYNEQYSGESSHTAERKILHCHSTNSELNQYPPNLMESLWFILMSTRRDKNDLEENPDESPGFKTFWIKFPVRKKYCCIILANHWQSNYPLIIHVYHRNTDVTCFCSLPNSIFWSFYTGVYDYTYCKAVEIQTHHI